MRTPSQPVPNSTAAAPNAGNSTGWKNRHEQPRKPPLAEGGLDHVSRNLQIGDAATSLGFRNFLPADYSLHIPHELEYRQGRGFRAALTPRPYHPPDFANRSIRLRLANDCHCFLKGETMKRVTVFFCLATVGMLVLAETSSAQIFKRVWQRRKAEIRSEVYGQVSSELTAKLDADLAQQMDAAKQELKTATEQQVTAEAEKLTAHVKAEIAKMQEEAQKLVAEESAKLQQRAAAEVKKIKEEAEAKVAAEAKRLDEQVQAGVAKLQEEGTKQVQDAVAQVTGQVDKIAADLKKAIDDQLAKLPDQVAAEVQKQADKQKAEIAASATPPAPEPQPEEPKKAP